MATTDDVYRAECPARQVLDHLTSRWATLVLAALHERPMRFSALRRRIEGVSEKMLSQTLRTLGDDGLVIRTVTADSPPAVTYELSPLGHQASDALQPLLRWVQANAKSIAATRSGGDGGGPG